MEVSKVAVYLVDPVLASLMVYSVNPPILEIKIICFFFLFRHTRANQVAPLLVGAGGVAFLLMSLQELILWVLMFLIMPPKLVVRVMKK